MSWDMKAFYAYFLLTFGLFAGGGILQPTLPAALRSGAAAAVVQGVALVVLVVLSVKHRRERGWRWPGVRTKNVLGALAAVVVIGAFVAPVIAIGAPGPATAWVGGVFGMGLFAILGALHLVQAHRDDFDRCCTGERLAPEDLEPTAAKLPAWKRVIYIVFQLWFLSTFFSFLGAMYLHLTHMKKGSPEPTAEQTVELTNHGETVYIDPTTSAWIEGLLDYAKVCIPATFVVVLILQFVLRIPVMPMPWDEGRRRSRRDR
tara:strand:- start:6215 stop:6994 length:780 start_codon:yes stop_codon:yes gene_type:complete